MASWHSSRHFSNSPFSKYTAEGEKTHTRAHGTMLFSNPFKMFPNRYWWAMEEQHVLVCSSLSRSALPGEVYLLCWRCRSCWSGRVSWPPHNVSVPLQSLYSCMQNSQVPFPSRPVRGEIGRVWLGNKRLTKQHQSHEMAAHHIAAGRRDGNWFTSRLFSGRSSSLGGGGWVSLGLGAGGGGGAGSSSISERFMPSNTESVVITLGSCSFLSSKMFSCISYTVISKFIVLYFFFILIAVWHSGLRDKIQHLKSWHRTRLCVQPPKTVWRSTYVPSSDGLLLSCSSSSL